MTEQITIEGDNLAIRDHLVANRDDPKRKRPPRFAPSGSEPVRSSGGWTIEEMIDVPNPYHPEPDYDGDVK